MATVTCLVELKQTEEEVQMKKASLSESGSKYFQCQSNRTMVLYGKKSINSIFNTIAIIMAYCIILNVITLFSVKILVNATYKF